MAKFALITASEPLLLALFSEAKTTEAKMPMMATTTKSSINVKPFLKFIILKTLITNGNYGQTVTPSPNEGDSFEAPVESAHQPPSAMVVFFKDTITAQEVPSAAS